MSLPEFAVRDDAADVYGSRSLKRRRRTKAELAAIDEAIVDAVRLNSPITLRGVFYRVVSAGAIEKTEPAYRVIMRRLVKLRREGDISYSDITDGTREIFQTRAFDDLEAALSDIAASYRRQLWANQDHEVYVLTEKDAISGVVRPVTLKWHAPYAVLRGYASETFAYSLAESISYYLPDKWVHVYQLGDHDPSGVDAWRALTERVSELISDEFGKDADDVDFQRLAVTPAQITQWDLPTRPTKSSDPRGSSFDGESVEVDAIPPDTLRDLLEGAITQHIDQRQLQITQMAEESERSGLRKLMAQHTTDGGFGNG